MTKLEKFRKELLYYRSPIGVFNIEFNEDVQNISVSFTASERWIDIRPTTYMVKKNIAYELIMDNDYKALASYIAHDLVCELAKKSLIYIG